MRVWLGAGGINGGAPSPSSVRKDALDDHPVSPSSIVQTESCDGGLEAWCTVLGSFLAQFNGFGYGSAFGVYQDYYMRDFLSQESSSAISWIGSSSTFLLLALGLMCGPLHDKGHFYTLFVGGAFLQCFSLFMLSLAQRGCYYQVFLTQGLGSGLGLGLMYIPSIAVVSRHFSKRRTFAMSIVLSGASLGGVVHTIMLNKLINGSVGFAMGTRINAGFITILLFISCILVRPQYGQDHHPEAINTWEAMKGYFTDIPSLLLISAFFLFQLAILYPFFYFQADSIQHGLGTSFSFYSLVILNAASFCGRISGGFISRFIKVIDCSILSIATCVGLFVSTMALNSVADFVVLGILYGLASGIYVSMLAPSMILFARNPSEHGLRMGISFAILGIAVFIGTPIAGALLTDHYQWWAPAAFCGVVSSLGGLLLLYVRFRLAWRSEPTTSAQTTSRLQEDA